MTLLTADRGQALQVGAVLLFGILVILFSVWQAFVIPDQNERVEFSHNQEVQSEMVELRGEIISTADSTTPTSPAVKLGTQFPTRLLFVNPSPAAGLLQTESVGSEQFLVENANATAALGSGERLFWDGTNRSYETTSLTYAPEYRVFQGAPVTLYDNTVTYNRFEREGNTSALSEQSIIDGTTITLVALVGEYSESGVRSVTPDIQPVSTQARSVAIEDNESAGNITLRLPTRLGVSQWQQLLSNEENVRSVTSPSDETVEIELAEGEYELRMARVGVGDGIAETRPAYIEAIEGDDEEISAQRNHSITVEVRDRFNVPQNGINVTGSLENESKGNISPSSQTTSVNGQATFEFDPDASNLTGGETVPITFEGDGFEDSGVDNITVNVTIQSGTAGGSDLEIRWTNVQSQGRCEKKNDPEVGTYYTECSYNNINQFNGTYTLTAIADNATGVEVQFANTNDTLADIVDPNSGMRKPRGEFSNNSGTFEVEIELAGRNDISSLTETTLMAFAGDDTETLFIEVDGT